MQLLGLTMAELAAALGLATAATVALYLLREHRRRLEVASLSLWEPLLRDKQSSRLFLRLRHLISLLLALCIVWLLSLSLADPRPEQADAERVHRLLLIDAGLTMQATDVRGGRLASAVERARALLGTDAGGARTLIAQLDAGVTALCPMVGDGRTLEAALVAVRASDLPTDHAAGYRYALDALAGRSRPELVLISDRPEPPAPELAAALARAGIALRFEPIGRRSDNLAITAFSVRRYPLDRNRSELLIELHNASPHVERTRLLLLGDGVEIDAQALTLEPGSSVQRIYGDVTGAQQTLEARLSTEGDHDDLAADDRAYAVLPERRRTRVACVTEGNRFLEAALLLDEYLDVDVVTPARYRKPAGYDVAIFDRFVPDVPPGVPAIYLDPQATSAAAPLAIDGALERPAFERVEARHPILRFVTLRDVNVARARHVKPAPGDHVLAADPRGALLVLGRRAEQPFLALTFDVRESDLPLRTAWPLLLLNALDFLTAREADDPTGLEVGRPERVAVPGGARRATLELPDGSTRVIEASSGSFALSAERAGFHRVRAEVGVRVLAANLRAGGTHDLAPRAQLDVTGAAAPRPSVLPAGTGLPPWSLLLLAALAALVVELFTFHRRWTV